MWNGPEEHYIVATGVAGNFSPLGEIPPGKYILSHDFPLGRTAHDAFPPGEISAFGFFFPLYGITLSKARYMTDYLK